MNLNHAKKCIINVVAKVTTTASRTTILLSGWCGVTGSRRVRIPFPEDAPGFVRQLAGLMADGRFHGTFDRTYPLKNIADAFRYVETEQKTGIVVIDMGSVERGRP